MIYAAAVIVIDCVTVMVAGVIVTTVMARNM